MVLPFYPSLSNSMGLITMHPPSSSFSSFSRVHGSITGVAAEDARGLSVQLALCKGFTHSLKSWYSFVLCCVVLYCIALYGIVMVLYGIVLVLHGIVLQTMVLHYFAWFCTVLLSAKGSLTHSKQP